MGLALGAAGGALGGAVGQAICRLVPVTYQTPSYADIVVTLDSSGSMRSLLFFGSDPSGERKKATKQVDARGGTNLDAGLSAAIAELSAKRMAGRPQHIILS